MLRRFLLILISSHPVPVFIAWEMIRRLRRIFPDSLYFEKEPSPAPFYSFRCFCLFPLDQHPRKLPV
ncbi:hypothetical protein AMQ83_33270 [Paenibacillus riograndensis]|nr:hypothetical protein AMQ83_33270 [Paenibacillus riograndensis]